MVTYVRFRTFCYLLGNPECASPTSVRNRYYGRNYRCIDPVYRKRILMVFSGILSGERNAISPGYRDPWFRNSDRHYRFCRMGFFSDHCLDSRWCQSPPYHSRFFPLHRISAEQADRQLTVKSAFLIGIVRGIAVAPGISGREPPSELSKGITRLQCFD